jgi:hypothetical protein
MIVLALDMSTTCTGYALYDGSKLLTHGHIKAKVPGITKLKYPEKQLKVCKAMAQEIRNVYDKMCTNYFLVDIIVIEEINKHKNRLSGKTLDILHGFVWEQFKSMLTMLVYMDSDGMSGWRTRLNFRLSDADKLQNKEARKLNKNLAKGTKKIPIINKKHLACRYANRTYGTDLDCDERTTDGDVADAIGLGSAFVKSLS